MSTIEFVSYVSLNSEDRQEQAEGFEIGPDTEEHRDRSRDDSYVNQAICGTGGIVRHYNS